MIQEVSKNGFTTHGCWNDQTWERNLLHDYDKKIKCLCPNSLLLNFFFLIHVKTVVRSAAAAATRGEAAATLEKST
jgi:hypothetical protein